MDCLEVQALLSAMYDGEPVDPRALAQAKEHCATCPDCSAFLEGLKVIGSMRTPAAPKGVVDGVLAAVNAAAQERANAERIDAMQREVDLLAAADVLPEAAETPLPEPEEPSTRPAWFEAVVRRFDTMSDSVKWAGIGAAGALAATALIAFVIVSAGGGARTASTSGAATDSGTAGAPQNLTGYGVGSAPTTPSKPTRAAPASAPDYIAYNGHVYAPGALLADSSTATPTIGSVSTAFATGGAVVKATVYKSPISDGSIVVAGPDGFRIFTPVVRNMSSKRYQLAAGNTIDRFGVWPTLPTRFTPPTSADGAPTFNQAGIDANGVTIYAASGQPITTGFAVAPNTDTTDPAAGNPNWTWWDPID